MNNKVKPNLEVLEKNDLLKASQKAAQLLDLADDENKLVQVVA